MEIKNNKSYHYYIKKFLKWRLRYIKDREFIFILSILVGLIAGIAAVIIKNAVHFTQFLLTGFFVKEYQNFPYFFYPIVGILIALLFARFVIRQKLGHGIPNTLYAISKRKSIIPPFAMYASIVTSAFTVGFGGSVGLEGPTVATGSALGSNIAKFLRLNYKATTLLLACGAAGAISGIFNSPIAAIIFCIEVFMLDLTMSSLIPLLIASATAGLTSRLILGENVLFNITTHHAFQIQNIPFYILLGIFTGLLSVYFVKVYWKMENVFDRISNQYFKLVVFGSLLGVLIFLIPPLYGEGYDVINKLINGNYSDIVDNSIFYQFKENTPVLLLLLFGIVLLKVVASSLTFGAGGVGGIFAPSLFTGATAGFVFSKAINHWGHLQLPVSNFTLVGMAGLIAGVLHAPLTGLFLIAEVTGSYSLMIPLMITVAISYFTVNYFEPHSIYTKHLAKRGELITHNKDQAVLTLMNVRSEIETDFLPVKVSDSLGDLIKTISRSKRNIFPVLDNEKLVGIIQLDDVRDIMFNPDNYNKYWVENLMTFPPAIVYSDENMEQVMQKFQETEAWSLPVVENGRYIGFVSKAKLFNAYRRVLKDFSNT
ncbi:H(+)/Cl(-) exchange transporter ClcA [Flavobacteriales bacterium]|nr:Voltage-gated ClC-type chloride channel ClcB [Flavobacteriales bacterium]WKZ75339.1 MAG: chloride channel protein [Vicingaceae bacterium]GIK70741.1 MAG: chloride channel protein [Bacteroidota bacterium]CAG0992801.1 H(+)/Cl(-) exchange transporter ClcA [Flavobacteriales bacterium]